MRVTTVQNNTKPNFSGVNLIQVSKKLFVNQQDSSFDLASYMQTFHENIPEKIDAVAGFWESPLYEMLQTASKKAGFTNPYWLAKKYDMPLDTLANEKYDSFFVLTGDDLLDFSQIHDSKGLKKEIKRAAKEKFSEIIPHNLGEFLDKITDIENWKLLEFNRILASSIRKPDKTFTVNTKEELIEAVKNLIA